VHNDFSAVRERESPAFAGQVAPMQIFPKLGFGVAMKKE
jgi:hypothetical protein